MFKVRYENLELFLSGAVASLGTKLFERGDLEILKILMYMRGIEGILYILQSWISKLLSKIRGKQTEFEVPYGGWMLVAFG